MEPLKSAKPVRDKLSNPPKVVPFTRRNERLVAITERNRRNSTLLQLPGEMRNKIYEYTLYEGDYRCEHPARRPRLVEGSFANRLSILRVCYQIHEEVALLPFIVNTFCFFPEVSDLGYLECFLAVPQRCAITSIRLIMFDSEVQWRLESLQDPLDEPQLSYYMPGLRHVSVVLTTMLERLFGSATPGATVSQEQLESLRAKLSGRRGKIDVVFEGQVLSSSGFAVL